MDKQNLKSKFKAKKEQAMASAAMLTASLGMLPVNALKISAVSLKNNASDPDVIIGNAMGLIMLFAQWIGGFLILWGAFMLFLAMKNEEPESKSRAIMTMGCGIGLFGLRAILEAASII